MVKYFIYLQQKVFCHFYGDTVHRQMDRRTDNHRQTNISIGLCQTIIETALTIRVGLFDGSIICFLFLKICRNYVIR